MKSSRNRKICLLQPYPSPYRQGLLNALSRQLDGEVTVLYFFGAQSVHNWTYERTVEFREIYLKSSVKQIDCNTRRARLRFWSLLLALLKVRPAVVVCSDGPQGRMVRLVQWFMRFKMVCWTEESEISLRGTRPRRWLMRWMDRGVSAYVVPGKLGQHYVQRIRNYAGRVWIAPNTIDRSRFSATEGDVRAKFAQEEIRFLFSGRLIPLKGIDPLLAAFGRLAGTGGLPPYRLDIVGDGPMEKRAVGNVHYHGFLSQAECAEFMKRAHVLVLPSLWDCNPLVVTEAATAGCATLLSDGVGNWPEYTAGNGFVFERGNADALYESLLKVLNMDRDGRLKMALRSLEIASGVSHENSAKVFVQAIKECCSK